MADVRLLFWRAITNADFFEIERAREAASEGGGGQSYISISFRGLTHEELGRFLALEPPSRISTDRPTATLDGVGLIVEPSIRSPLEFAPRYRPPHADDRYRISRQNRQFQTRHPAWTLDRGFPQAPDDVVRRDPRTPDLTHLKIYVARLETGDYLAGFVNSGMRPVGFPGKLAPLFSQFDEQRSAGLIEFEPGELSVETLADAADETTVALDYSNSPPEVIEALEVTRVAAGKRPRGYGLRQNSQERRAIELHAMDLAIHYLRAEGWSVEDVSPYRPYDLHCSRGPNELRVEVKGTTGDGSVVLLTPGEVSHAREQTTGVALLVVSAIELSMDPTTEEVRASGGELAFRSPWNIDEDGELRPTGFEYRRH